MALIFSDARTKAKKEPTVSRVLVALAYGDGVVLLCEPSTALDFVCESGSRASIDGFVPENCGVTWSTENASTPGIYVGELRVVDWGPESWEMPQIRDYGAEIRNLRPVTKEEWKAHLKDEWPEGWNEST